jgi:hypothetical protein
MSGIIIIYNFSFLLLALIAFGLLRWWQVPAGSIIDWAIGIAIFEWLFAIVTIPWNIYFAARSTLETGTDSRIQGIEVEERQLGYARSISHRALIVAIGLHLISAAGLYYLAASGITPLGYISAGAALLLTFLRPAFSTYEYLAQRLSQMRQQFTYPRADIIELQHRLDRVENLAAQIDRSNEDAWIVSEQARWDTNRRDFADITAKITSLEATNELEHQRLAQEAKQAISQITVDGQFLDRARDLIRFIKTA